MGRFKINGLFFLKVRGFFDNDRRNLHYQTKPGKQLLHCPYTSYINVNFVVVYFSEQAVINCAANESKHDVRLDLFRRQDSHCGSLAIYVLCDANNQKLSSPAL